MIPLLELSYPVLVAVDVVAWGACHAITGYVAHRLPARWLAHDSWLTSPRRWEHEGRRYERLRIRRWKDSLPEAGALFAGGISKRTIPDPASGGLLLLAAETRRAEWGHWLAAACGPLFVLWNPLPIAAVMVVYGVAVNSPFIAIQRYNRLRVLRIVSRSGAASAGPAAASSLRAARARNARGTTGSNIP